MVQEGNADQPTMPGPPRSHYHWGTWRWERKVLHGPMGIHIMYGHRVSSRTRGVLVIIRGSPEEARGTERKLRQLSRKSLIVKFCCRLLPPPHLPWMTPPMYMMFPAAQPDTQSSLLSVFIGRIASTFLSVYQ